MTESPTKKTWRAMRKRCYLKHDISYKNYGAKGIKICKRWHTFKNFLEDMGPRPPRMQIDRIDNTKDYSPDNCRWVTKTEQVRNRSITQRVLYKGEYVAIAHLAEISGMYYNTLYRRLKRGIPVDIAITNPHEMLYIKNMEGAE